MFKPNSKVKAVLLFRHTKQFAWFYVLIDNLLEIMIAKVRNFTR